METTMIIILCGLIGGAIYYLLEEIRRVNDKAEYQYIQAKLSNIQSNLCLVDYLLKSISK